MNFDGLVPLGRSMCDLARRGTATGTKPAAAIIGEMPAYRMSSD